MRIIEIDSIDVAKMFALRWSVAQKQELERERDLTALCVLLLLGLVSASLPFRLGCREPISIQFTFCFWVLTRLYNPLTFSLTRGITCLVAKKKK
jgi:hypothetical protein